MQTIREAAPLSPVYTQDIPSGLPPVHVPDVPVNGYAAFIRPAADEAARRLGDACAEAVTANRFADFERSPAWCARHGAGDPDQMVHVSTFLILDGMVYMTYYANTSTADEDHTKQEARLAFCPVDVPEDMTIVRLQKVGDTLDGYGKTIEVVELRYRRSGWVLISRDGNGYADTFAFTHHHADSWERIIEDACKRAADGYPDNGGCIAMTDLVARCKALAGDAE